MDKHASLFSVTRILYIIVILFLILPGALIAVEPDHYSIRVQEGLRLVETFYTFLLSDADLKDCPDIFEGYYYGPRWSIPVQIFAGDSYYWLGHVVHDFFYESKARKRMEKKVLIAYWKMLRNNKELFLFPYGENEPSHDVKGIMKLRGYYFFKPPPGSDYITEGYLSIVISSAIGYPDGFIKQVFFPICYDERKQAYAISNSILINGIFYEEFDVAHYGICFDRDFDLVEQLGFKKQKSHLEPVSVLPE